MVLIFSWENDAKCGRVRFKIFCSIFPAQEFSISFVHIICRVLGSGIIPTVFFTTQCIHWSSSEKAYVCSHTVCFAQHYCSYHCLILKTGISLDINQVLDVFSRNLQKEVDFKSKGKEATFPSSSPIHIPIYSVPCAAPFSGTATLGTLPISFWCFTC